jgi:hypothetical protein
MMNVNAGSGVIGILIDGILQLAHDVVDVDEVLLGACVGHGQIVLLDKRVLARRWAAMQGNRSC